PASSNIPALVAADFSGDGKTDLALLTPDYHEVTSYINLTKYPGYVHGIVFDDSNADHVASQFETRLSGWQVYLDPNDNDMRDPGELTVLTDATGHYLFPANFPARYNVRIQRPVGWQITAPVSPTGTGDGYWVTQVIGGSSSTYTDFGVIHPGF